MTDKNGLAGGISVAFAFALALLALISSGPFPILINSQDMISQGAALCLAVLILLFSKASLAARHPAAPGMLKFIFWIIDFAMMAGIIYAVIWFFRIQGFKATSVYFFSQKDIIIGLIGLAILLELARRAFGPIIAVICLVFLAYAVYGNLLPGAISHNGHAMTKIINVMWYSNDGVFGRILSIVVRIVMIFILFGAVLESTGGTAVLLRLATAATQRLRGGMAHSAIVASALFGTINGSPVANVVSTGVFTIPLIKKQGFSSSFAGGVEAAASTAGQFTPPIMAAGAFIVAEMAGVEYLSVAAAAVLPALFYYFCLFATVNTEARRLGIEPVAPADRIRLTRSDAIQSLRIIVPLVVVVWLLISGRSPGLAGFYAVGAAFLIGLIMDIKPSQGVSAALIGILNNFVTFLKALTAGGRGAAMILIVIGAVGIIIGAVNLTGIGIKFANMVALLAGDSLILALLLAMVASIFLGMGLPTLPAFLIIALFLGPSIKLLGTPPLLAYLFVFYFGVLANITPPVALAAYAASPIAQSNPLTTAMQAMRLAIVGFLIPYVWIYYPSLSLVEGFAWPEFIWVMLRLPLAIWLITTALSGIEVVRFGWLERVSRFVLAIAMLFMTSQGILGTVLSVDMIQLICFALGAGMVIHHRRVSAPRQRVSLPTN